MKYATVDRYKLISKYSKNDPLQEFTSGQALVLPVIENVDQIYVIDCTESKSAEVDEAAEEDDTEDVYITINGKKYSKPTAIAQLKALGVKNIKTNSSDRVVIEAFNSLSDADEAIFLENVPEITGD